MDTTSGTTSAGGCTRESGTCERCRRDCANEGGRCRIHPAKPFECRDALCTDTGPSSAHEDAAMAWKDHQGQVAELLGREPVAAPYYGDGLLGLLGSMGL